MPHERFRFRTLDALANHIDELGSTCPSPTI